MPDVFLSYSRANLAEAAQLEQALEAAGISVWRDVRALRAGQLFIEELAYAILDCQAVVWLASEASAQSRWVQRELFYAAEKNRLILPVRLAGLVPEAIPESVQFLLGSIQQVSLQEYGWHQVAEEIRGALQNPRAQFAQAKPAGQLPSDVVDSTLIEVSDPPALLPIRRETPLLVGLAVDVSGSMQAALGPRTRLEGVLDAIHRLSSRYQREGLPPEIQQAQREARIFAYGFGFADRLASWGALGSLLHRALGTGAAVAREPGQGVVRDLLHLAGLSPSTITFEQLTDGWEGIDQAIRGHTLDMLGTTHLRAALQQVRTRFVTEFASYPGLPRSVLLVVSDGESADGNAVDICRQIQQQRTLVLTGYLTGTPLTEPRRLHAVPQRDWPAGARDLFRCASVLEEASPLLHALRHAGWKASEGDRLFVQFNQSEHLEEVAGVLLDLAEESAG